MGTKQSVFGHMTSPGQWAGGFAAWDEFGVYFATGRAESPGRVLRVESAQLRRLAEQWFPFGLHFIHGLVNTVRRIESTARQREALVALGTLSAGLAHELNNPASAATRAADTLQSTSTALLVALSHLAATGISPEQFTVLNDLRLRVSDSGDEPAPTAIALADREDELSEWLVDHEVDRDWEIAPALAAAGRMSSGARRSPGAFPVPPSAPRWSGWAPPSPTRHCCARSRRRPGASPPSSPPSGPTPRWTAPPCRPPTSSRVSTAPW